MLLQGVFQNASALSKKRLLRCSATSWFATSSKLMHHVPTLDAKQDVFRSIHAALRPGGVFVNTDATMSADPGARQAEYQTWAAHLVACGISEERAWGHFKEWADEDTYFPLEVELARLTSVVTSNPANDGHRKTGQWDGPGPW